VPHHPAGFARLPARGFNTRTKAHIAGNKKAARSVERAALSPVGKDLTR